MTATEAARSFSDVLNRVASGEEIEIVRNGAAVAVIRAPKPRFVSADRLREIVAGPTLDDDFAAEMRALREASDPVEDPWGS
jgi:prevent-host-death family protein